MVAGCGAESNMTVGSCLTSPSRENTREGHTPPPSLPLLSPPFPAPPLPLTLQSARPHTHTPPPTPFFFPCHLPRHPLQLASAPRGTEYWSALVYRIVRKRHLLWSRAVLDWLANALAVTSSRPPTVRPAVLSRFYRPCLMPMFGRAAGLLSTPEGEAICKLKCACVFSGPLHSNATGAQQFFLNRGP